jgi:Fic family protein
MPAPETPQRVEPTRLEDAPPDIADAVAELSAATATLGAAPHPRTAANLADVVRVMNSYYSNLIEGHVTRPRDIVRALAGELDDDEARRNLQIEAAAHVRVQQWKIDLPPLGAIKNHSLRPRTPILDRPRRIDFPHPCG